MRLPSYLIRNRLGVFYLRVVFPLELRVLFPALPREMRRSLRTRNPVDAKRHAVRFTANYTEVLQLFRNYPMSNNENNSQWLFKPFADGSISVKKEEGDEASDLKQITLALMAAGRVPADVMSNPLLKAVYTPNETERHEGQQLLRQQSNSGKGEWLSDSILRYKADMELEGAWQDENTWPSAYEPTLRHFREIIAPDESQAQKRQIVDGGKIRAIYDIPVGEIDETLIRRFKSAMSAWPKGFGQGTRGKAKYELTAKDALSATHLPKQSPGNAIKKCEVIKAFLRWAERDGCISAGERFARILPNKQRRNEGKKNKRGYEPFTLNELRRMFESAEYQKPLNKPGAQYWIPLIGLYTGARINEIAQLNLSDIKISEDGIRCFHITEMEDEDEHDGELDPMDPINEAKFEEKDTVQAANNDNRKSLKSNAADRMVPIHPILIEIGLNEYIDLVQKRGATRLFPELSYEAKSGYGRLPSRHFREFTQRLGIYKERKKVFHSFRSTLNGFIQGKGMHEEHRSRLIGHATKTVNDRHYGGQTPLQLIAEQLYKVDFGINHPKYSVPVVMPDKLI
jgi:integrase